MGTNNRLPIPNGVPLWSPYSNNVPLPWINYFLSFLGPGSPAGGDLGGTYPNPTISSIDGAPVAWQTYTPALTSTNGGDTIPVYNNTTGVYAQAGKLVFVQDVFRTITTPGSGTGNLIVSIPVALNISVGSYIPAIGIASNAGSTTGYIIHGLPIDHFHIWLYYVAQTWGGTEKLVPFTPSQQTAGGGFISLTFAYLAS